MELKPLQSINKMMFRRIFFLSILLYFLFASLAEMTTLGLSHDEGQRGLESLGILQFKHFPLMREFYTGAVVSYLQTPFFIMFGPTVFAIRFTEVMFSLGSIICVYYVCSKWFNYYIGLLSALLLSINSVFIWTTKLGAEREEILQIFLFWLGLTLIQLYIDKKRKRYLYGGFFVFGVALSAKIEFLGFMVGISASILLFGKNALNFIKNRIFDKRYNILTSITMFLLGSSLILAYNVTSRGETIVRLWKILIEGSELGVNNLDFINNVSRRLLDFKSLLTDSIFLRYNNIINLILFLFSLLIIISYLFFLKKPSISKNRTIFLINTYLFLFLTTAFAPRSYDHAVIVIMFPIIQIIIAISTYLIINLFKKNKICMIVVFLILFIPAIYTEVNLYNNYLYKLRITGGEGHYSNAVYALVDYLNGNNIKRNVFSVGEWGAVGNVNFLMKDKVVTPLPYMRKWYQNTDSKFKTFLEEYKKAYFIRIIDWDSEGGNYDFRFLRESALRDKKIISEVRLFRNRAGKACYGLYKLE